MIGAIFEVYNTLGFGFLEHVYVMALERELRARGHRVARQVGVNVAYKGDVLCAQRLDMVVDGTLVVEIKSTFDLHQAARRQVYNYLCATSLEVGLLLHFGPEAKFYRFMSRNTQEAAIAVQSPESVRSPESGNPSSLMPASLPARRIQK